MRREVILQNEVTQTTDSRRLKKLIAGNIKNSINLKCDQCGGVTCNRIQLQDLENTERNPS